MPFGKTAKNCLARLMRLGGNSLGENRWKNNCAVFAFHRIIDPEQSLVYTSSTASLPVRLFTEFARLISERYHPLSYPEFEQHLLAGRAFPRCSCMITFDDGWQDNYAHAWPVLQEYRLPATIFVPAAFIGTEKRFWQDELYAAFQVLREKRRSGPFFFEAHVLADVVYDLLEDPQDRVWFYTREAVERLKGTATEFAGRSLNAILAYAFGESAPSPASRAFLNREEVTEMAAGGIYFGSHSVNHKILPPLADDELKMEIRQSRDEVAALTGQPTTAFSYPNGDYDSRTAQQVREAGYTTAFTIDYGTVERDSNPFALRRIDMTADMLSLADEEFSRSKFCLETSPWLLNIKRRRQTPVHAAEPAPDRKIRLLYLIDSMLGEAGTEKQIVNLIRLLPRQRYEIYLACFIRSEWLDSLDLPCRIYHFNAPSFRHPSAYFKILRFARFLRRERIDIIQTFFPAANLVGVASGALARVPLIITSRRNFGHALTTSLKWMMYITNRLTHRILANSFSVKQRTMVLESVHSRQVDVIYNGVDLPSPSPQSSAIGTKDKSIFGFVDDQPVVGIVANLRPIKGVQYFIEAAAIIARQNPATRFVVVGYGELQIQLKQLVDRLDLSDKVKFMGRQSDVFKWLESFDIAVLSSLSEGFSNSILEYMAARLPVVATDVGSNWEAVENDFTGYLAQTKNPADIALKILALLDHPRRRQEMGLAGFRRVQRDFGMQRMVNRFDEYYRYSLTTPHHERRFEV